MLGALLSANMTTTYEVTIADGNAYQLPGTSIIFTILDIDQTNPESGIHSVEYDTTFMVTTTDTQVLGFGVTRLAYDRVDRLHQEVSIISSVFSDIYVVTQGILINRLSGRLEASVLQIRIIPYISVLWAGCILLHFAILPLTIGRFVQLRKALSEKDEEIEKMGVAITLPMDEKPIIGGE
jgi:cytochrome c biogenesis factor